MKLSRMISNLHNSTKATVIACSVLLAMTAVVLFFLMLFPIKMRDKSAALSAPVMPETTVPGTTAPMEELIASTKEPPHTRSTWAATIETIATTSDTKHTSESTDIPWYDKIFTTSSAESTAETFPEMTTVYQEEETLPPDEPAPQPEEPITLPEPVTEAPVQTITEVVPVPETESPLTEPEIINAEPVAPEFQTE